MKRTAFLGAILLAGITLSGLTGLAQPSPARTAGAATGGSPTGSDSPNMRAIKAYYTAFEKNDWSLIQQVLADGFTFSSPLDDHINVKTFRERCWPNAGKFKRFDLEKVIIEGDNAFVIINGWTLEGKLIRNSDYFRFKDGKIRSYECFFGPGVNYPNSGK